MLVDWFTTVAQIINFLILVWLLKRFLYKPILRAIDEREKRMTNALAEAKDEKRRAEAARLAYEESSRALTAAKEETLKKATEDAQAERKRLISTAREDASKLESQWRAGLEQEKRAAFREFGVRIENEIFAISRQLLCDLAGIDLDARIAERFAQRLEASNDADSDSLISSLRASPGAVIVTSASDLPEDSKRQIEAAVRQKAGTLTGIQFMTAPELIAGIELRTNGHKISWTIESYLSSLRQHIADTLETSGLTNVEPAA